MIYDKERFPMMYLTALNVVEPKDIQTLEATLGENLCDMNYWTSNPFSIYGFARGIGEHGFADNLLRNGMINPTCEAFSPSRWETYEMYCDFCSKVINTFPEYRERFNNCVKDLYGFM